MVDKLIKHLEAAQEEAIDIAMSHNCQYDEWEMSRKEKYENIAKVIGYVLSDLR